MRQTIFFGFGLILCLLTCGALETNVRAATLTVTKTADTNDGVCNADCSLREAIAVSASGDTIDFSTLFDTPQIININGQLVISKTLTVTGKGANLLTVRNAAASSTSRVFNLSAGTINLSGMTITGGNVNGSSGGGITSGSSANTTLTNVHVTGNTADFVGGILVSSGTLNVVNSTVSNNTSNNGGSAGGGIDSSGTLNVTNSTISGNRAPITNNNAGGILVLSGNTTITNSTITDNEAAGGAMSASGVYRGGGTVTVRNSIIAANRNNATTPDVLGAFTSSGYNIIGNRGTATGFTATGDQTGSSPFAGFSGGNDSPQAVLDPLLQPLLLNAGTTPTHTLKSNSPAIDKGNSFGNSLDQRGRPLPLDNLMVANTADGADIGAVESQAPLAASVIVGGKVLTPEGRGLRNALVTLTNQAGESRTVLTTAFGYYRFNEVAAGEVYIISVNSKRYSFAPQIVTVTEKTGELNLTALE